MSRLRIQEVKERLLAESDAWAESVNFAVTHELDGRLAYRLLVAFSVIPTCPEKNVQPVPTADSWKGVDPQTAARARISRRGRLGARHFAATR